MVFHAEEGNCFIWFCVVPVTRLKTVPVTKLMALLIELVGASGLSDWVVPGVPPCGIFTNTR